MREHAVQFNILNIEVYLLGVSFCLFFFFLCQLKKHKKIYNGLYYFVPTHRNQKVTKIK